MPSFREVFGGISQGLGDNVRAGVADIQGQYAQTVWGISAPTTSLTGDIVTTTTPQEAEPESYGAALRTYSDNEQAEIRADYETKMVTATPVADDSPSVSAPAAPETAGYEPEV